MNIHKISIIHESSEYSEKTVFNKYILLAYQLSYQNA